MAYTTIKKASDYFNTKLYTGTGAEQSISSLDFSPDLTWIKNRDTTDWHRLLDSVRGATEELYSNDNNAEVTQAQSLKSFDSNGFTLGTLAEVNTSGENYASWNWRGSDSSAVSNTDGSITSTVSANTTSGFSIVSYTGTGANATVGHGLGVAPKMIIIKNRDSAVNWLVYHDSIPATNTLILNTTDASASDAAYNNTDPTSSVFSLGVTGSGNGSGNNLIAYCFADVQGFSKFGSYTGNGQASTSSPFIYTGFKPAFVIIKNTIDTHGWSITDNKRNGYNENSVFLYANTSDADASYPMTSFYSNGFQPIEAGADKGATNQSGDTYIYMAFAEEPLVGDNPATAR
jgi:hypothetical protein